MSVIKRLKAEIKKSLRKMYLALMRLRGLDNETFYPFHDPIHIPAALDNEIRFLLAKGRPYEAPEAAMVQAHLRLGQNVIELGGCFGVVSAVIRRAIGPEAVHLIVEADPKLADVCRENAGRNASPGRTTVLAAAVDYSGRESVSFTSGRNAHVGHLSETGESGTTVPAVTLRKLVDKIPPGPFALVCDIEGAEIALIAAEADLLSRIVVLILETHPHVYVDGEADRAKMLAALAASGLRIADQSEGVFCFTR